MPASANITQAFRCWKDGDAIDTECDSVPANGLGSPAAGDDQGLDPDLDPDPAAGVDDAAELAWHHADESPRADVFDTADDAFFSAMDDAVASALEADDEIHMLEAVSIGDNGEIADDQQLECLHRADSGESFLILGSAGTGKSTVVATIVRKISRKYLDAVKRGRETKFVAIVAPTGRAAGNVGGQTIHSFFGFCPQYDTTKKMTNSGRWKQSVDASRKAGGPYFTKLKALGTLIIDEISMLASEHMCEIDKMLQHVHRNDRPFGGVQVIGVGDFYQLPPVNVFHNRHDYCNSPQFCFLPAERTTNTFARLFASQEDIDAYTVSDFTIPIDVIRHITLHTNHRQSGDRLFFEILENLRAGILINDHATALLGQSRTHDGEVPGNVLRLMATNVQVKAYNASRLEQLPEAPVITASGFVHIAKIGQDGVVSLEQTGPGVYPAYEPNSDTPYGLAPTYNAIEERCRLPFNLDLKVGCRVMILANQCVDAGIYNGATGELVGIACIGAGGITVWNGSDGSNPPALPILANGMLNGLAVRLDKTSEVVSITRNYFRFPVFDQDNTKMFVFNQFPVVLAYAMTIHKCQGATLDSACIHPNNFRTPGSLYVAISRCKTLDTVFLCDWHNTDEQRSLIGPHTLLKRFFGIAT
jgi:hypothetical protein